MKHDVKQKWINALTSGEYQQCINGMHIENKGYCVLGVLCDLYRREVGGGEWTADSDSDTPQKLTFLGSDLTLPWQVQQWAGLSEEDPCADLEGNTDGEGISIMNDVHGYGFKDLALAIKRSL